MVIINKIKKLPENQKLIIIWVIIIIIAITFAFWRINSFKPTIENFTKDDWGITPSEDTVNEIKKSSETIKESTNAIKEGFEAIKDLGEDIKELKNPDENDKETSIDKKIEE